MKIIRKHFKSISSTNSWLKKDLRSWNNDEMMVISSDQQISGRGRGERYWASPAEGNIYLSFGFKLPLPCDYVANVAQVLAIAAVKACQELGFKVKIKWPNDLILNGNKLGGVLCEVITERDHCRVVAGIGLNVNMSSEVLASIDQPATSLKAETGQEYDHNAIRTLIEKYFFEALQILKEQGFYPFYLVLDKLLYLKKEKIAIDDGKRQFEAVWEKLNGDGSIRLRKLDGSVVDIAGGEISYIN
ncbi:MAG: biotin--[acetyl-CoA-carboxylase] ligase [Chlamydiota bacterium]